MELESFVANFAAQFEETDSSEFMPETVFKEVSEWDSLISLCVIAMIDEECHVRVNGDDIKRSVTIRDLYEIVKSRC